MPATVVQWTKELRRVLALPTRTEVADPREVSALFLRPGATGCLRPLQALALAEAFTRRGLLALLGVGEGKTLLSFLLPLVLGSARPLLLVPGALLTKTRRDYAALAETWALPTNVRVESYQLIGQPDNAERILTWAPDAIIADEVQSLANTSSGCTRRVGRYLTEDAPGTPFCGMTGSLMKHDLTDFAHLARWALGGQGAPLPAGWPELAAWNAVLGAKAEPGIDPGALAEVWPEPRAGFRERFMSTVGVVGGPATDLEAGLEIGRWAIRRTPVVQDALDRLDPVRGDMTRPDGWELMGATEAWALRRQLVLGFYYRWDPLPPRPWMAARKLWLRCSRRILATNRSRLDTPGAIERDVDAGGHPTVVLDPEGTVSTVAALAAWRAIEPTFEPNPVPVWIEPDPLRISVSRWRVDGPGIVFCEHDAVARRIGEWFNLNVYGAEGFTSDGRYIDDAPTDRAIVATTGANKQGRNLQAWSRALVVSPPPNGKDWEQLLGRLHRLGQGADTVRYDVIDGGLEWSDAVQRDARAIGSLFGQRQRLELATWL
jgi:hypothetical protein